MNASVARAVSGGLVGALRSIAGCWPNAGQDPALRGISGLADMIDAALAAPVQWGRPSVGRRLALAPDAPSTLCPPAGPAFAPGRRSERLWCHAELSRVKDRLSALPPLDKVRPRDGSAL